MKEWFEKKCNPVRELDFNPDSRIKYVLKDAMKTGKHPIGLNRLKEYNPELYSRLSFFSPK